MNSNRIDFAFGIRLRLRIDPQHQRNVGAVHVGIKQPNLVAQLHQRDR